MTSFLAVDSFAALAYGLLTMFFYYWATVDLLH